MNVVIDFKSSKMYYVVYKQYGLAVTIEYNVYDFNGARNKAIAWAAEDKNRRAVVYSITEKDINPKEELIVENQFVEELEQKVS